MPAPDYSPAAGQQFRFQIIDIAQIAHGCIFVDILASTSFYNMGPRELDVPAGPTDPRKGPDTAWGAAMSNDYILEKLIRSRKEYATINRQAQQLYRRVLKEPATFSPHQKFKLELAPPYVVFDYGMELDKQKHGHWQLSEFGRTNFAAWLPGSHIGQRMWLLIMYDTHTFLAFATRHPDYAAAESFIVVKPGELERLMAMAEERNLLFGDPIFDFITHETNSSPIGNDAEQTRQRE